MEGPCAKQKVLCILWKRDSIWIGENYCRNSQEVCPREPGEGYEKCKSICDQVGHAEEVALSRAREHAKGCSAELVGHDHYCASCQRQLFAAGVVSLSIRE